MKLVLDTNVLVQALSSQGASHWLLRQILPHCFELAADLKAESFGVVTPGEFVSKWRRQNE